MRIKKLAIAAVAVGVGLATISATPAAANAEAFTFAGVADYDHDGSQDLVVRENASGNLWLFPGDSTRGYSSQPRAQIGTGWNGFTFAGVADWDHDGHQDIVARNDATGDLWLYPGQSVRAYSSIPRVKIGSGW
ncbi:VCBS repeat-containing protein [Dactylosporangium salmoneum]|uniref:VCBS repeat-containing protein n=1 Tax=Dactylosporangium salmoneum TaxID=53361 RepID=A0ABN3G3N1_9ACTN